MGRKTNSISLRLKKTNKDYNHCWYGDILYAYNFNRCLNIQKILYDNLYAINIQCPQISLTHSYKKANLLLCYLDPLRKKFLSESLYLKIREKSLLSSTHRQEKFPRLPLSPFLKSRQKAFVSKNVHVQEVFCIDLYGNYRKNHKHLTTVYHAAKKKNVHIGYRCKFYNHKGAYGNIIVKYLGENILQNMLCFKYPKLFILFGQNIPLPSYRSFQETLLNNEKALFNFLEKKKKKNSGYLLHTPLKFMCNFSQKYAPLCFQGNFREKRQGSCLRSMHNVQKKNHRLSICGHNINKSIESIPEQSTASAMHIPVDFYKSGVFLAFICYRKSVCTYFGKNLQNPLKQISEKIFGKQKQIYQQPFPALGLWAEKNAVLGFTKMFKTQNFIKGVSYSVNSLWGNGVSIYFIKYTNEKACALFLANVVRYLLERKVLFRRIKRQLLLSLSSNYGEKKRYFSENPFSSVFFQNTSKYAGVRISCSGRVGGRSKKAQRSRKEIFMWGETGLHVFSKSIDFAKTYAETSFGTVGVKVWVCYK